MRVHDDVLVLDTKTQAMQAIARLVGDGYVYWTTGMVSWARARKLVRRFRDLYLIHLEHNARYRRQRQGLANARLVLYAPTPRSSLPEAAAPDGLFFALLVTEGDHPAHILERLRHAAEDTDHRLTVDAYELVRHTRTGRERPSWTWRLTAAAFQSWRDRIVLDVRHKNQLRISQSWQSLHRIPGFGGSRTQVRTLVKLFRGEVQRVFKNGSFRLPAVRHGYVSLMRMTGRPLHWYVEDRHAREDSEPSQPPCAEVRE